MNELISCIVPSFNRAELLKEAIESTILQTYQNWELIIVDDHSVDHTAEMVRSFMEKDARIQYYLNREKGVSSARNLGIQMAKGDYLAFLDDDDIHLPHRFDSQLKAMISSGTSFLVSGFRSCDRATGRILDEAKLELKATCTGFPSRWMIRKNLLDKTGLFDQRAAPLEDIELSARIARHETFAQHNDIVSVTFPTENSASSATEKKINARLFLLETAMDVFQPLETGWWQFTVATDSYMLGRKEMTREYLSKAAKNDPRGIYKLAYWYFSIAGGWEGPFKRITLKVLTILREFGQPVQVHHPVVNN